MFNDAFAYLIILFVLQVRKGCLEEKLIDSLTVSPIAGVCHDCVPVLHGPAPGRLVSPRLTPAALHGKRTSGKAVE